MRSPMRAAPSRAPSRPSGGRVRRR
jgi:hypothetical protein